MTRQEKIEAISEVMNETKAYNLIAKKLGIKINHDSDMFHHIEGEILEAYEIIEEESKNHGQ